MGLSGDSAPPSGEASFGPSWEVDSATQGAGGQGLLSLETARVLEQVNSVAFFFLILCELYVTESLGEHIHCTYQSCKQVENSGSVLKNKNKGLFKLGTGCICAAGELCTCSSEAAVHSASK